MEVFEFPSACSPGPCSELLMLLPLSPISSLKMLRQVSVHPAALTSDIQSRLLEQMGVVWVIGNEGCGMAVVTARYAQKAVQLMSILGAETLCDLSGRAKDIWWMGGTAA